MSRPRFLADHDLQVAIVRGTVRSNSGIEFKRLWDFGLERASDPVVLRFAAREKWIVVSHDVNTMTAAALDLISEDEPMHGLLLVRQQEPIARIIESLTLIWSASEAEEWAGMIQYFPL